MNIISLPPSAALNMYVVRYLVVNSRLGNDSIFKMIPRSFPALIFTSPEMPVVENQMSLKNINYSPANIYCGGMSTDPVLMKLRAGSYFIVALLQPYCTGLFLGEDAFQFTRNLISISELDTGWMELNEKIWDDPHLPAKITLIEKKLYKIIGERTLCASTKQAIENIRMASGNISLAQLTLKTYTSERNLRRKFQIHVGISPIQYANMIRFNSFIRKALSSPKLLLNHMAFEYEYADLSHLYKDFMKFTGDSPKNFLNQNHQVNRSILESDCRK